MIEIDPRAQEWEIFGHAMHGAAKTREILKNMAAKRSGTLSGCAYEDQIEGELKALAKAMQARPAQARTVKGCANRMLDVSWWVRNLRRELLRENEAIEQASGAIRRARQCYVSEFAMERKQERAIANRKTLEGLEVVSEDGEILNLAEVADKSVSNPAIRRAELMMRARGFEETAEYMTASGEHYGGFFLTLTCPSRFHRFSGAGRPNTKWTGETTKDAQKYLSAMWAKIRAAWKRRGFSPFGFRVAEPHHDGCIHWHILLFAPKDQIGDFDGVAYVRGGVAGVGIVGVAGAYCLEESPAERGAAESRFTCKLIEPGKGTAAGYIAKYISKNIDGLKEGGEGMGLDRNSATDARQASKRVKTWAQTWGIRQFQQIGGPSVTVWRELRRVESSGVNQSAMLTGPQEAADRSLWSLFWVLQGGPEVASRNLSLRSEYLEAENKYGETVKKMFGVLALDGCFLATRLKEWTVQRAGTNANNVKDWDHKDAMQSQQRIKKFLSGSSEVWTINGGVATAWTSVNNCTENTATGFDFSKFEGEKRESINPPPTIEGVYIDGLKFGGVFIDGMPVKGSTECQDVEVIIDEMKYAWEQEEICNQSYKPHAKSSNSLRAFA